MADLKLDMHKFLDVFPFRNGLLVAQAAGSPTRTHIFLALEK